MAAAANQVVVVQVAVPAGVNRLGCLAAAAAAAALAALLLVEEEVNQLVVAEVATCPGPLGQQTPSGKTRSATQPRLMLLLLHPARWHRLCWGWCRTTRTQRSNAERGRSRRGIPSGWWRPRILRNGRQR